MSAVTPHEFHTESGDTIRLHLFVDSTGDPEIFLTVLDVDESQVPTVRLSLREAGAFRDVLRRLCECGQRVGTANPC